MAILTTTRRLLPFLLLLLLVTLVVLVVPVVDRSSNRSNYYFDSIIRHNNGGVVDDKLQRTSSSSSSGPSSGIITTDNESSGSIAAAAGDSNEDEEEGTGDGGQPAETPPPAGTVQFVFFVGIEGTGHHYMTELLKNSPTVLDLIQKLGLRVTISKLSRTLYHRKDGYLNLHCKSSNMNNNFGGNNEIATNTTRNQVIRLMKQIVTKVNNSTTTVGSSSSSSQSPSQSQMTTIPLNAGGYINEMSSYPQDGGSCRPLRYPNLGLLYDICRDAQVACKHMYLYRDSYSIIKSTTVRRHFNRGGILQAIHEYITMLYVILGEFTMYGTNDNNTNNSGSGGHSTSSRTMGCFGMEESARAIMATTTNINSTNTNSTSTSTNNTATMSSSSATAESQLLLLYEQQWGPIRDMFGWGKQRDAQFQAYIKKHFHEPSLPSFDLIQQINSPQYKSYMDSMIDISNSVIEMCKKQQRM